MLDKGVISPSPSPWSLPVVLVSKKTENGVQKYNTSSVSTFGH